MSTSHIPIYYDNHLVGSITLAEFMTQKRYSERSVMELMSLSKEELIAIFLAFFPEKEQQARSVSAKKLLFAILYLHKEQHKREWEAAALNLIRDVYLRK